MKDESFALLCGCVSERKIKCGRLVWEGIDNDPSTRHVTNHVSKLVVVVVVVDQTPRKNVAGRDDRTRASDRATMPG